ncbi:cytochrome c oxidase subunit XV assembly protein [Coniosporium apollinis CBS 100218]|uniref:Cytochrome c oxidase subunit XV assembly protein n=1 Tax=Coniosporium apollinis (strain CBS 100218) TaxID=1168221 RepID=R7Z1V8_CONA1|nr:cytochrome c oxidase subunit XV assembly protein [Coniosporium apollinis CBS 100218]EON68122.1 cytochrome c oxidase subunit XV assembly protein [Coniosporium apollinis CBS 100218]
MVSIFQTFPLLRRAAPRLSKEFFVCSVRPASTRASQPVYRSVRQTPFLQAFRSQTTHAHRPGTSTALGRDGSSPLGALSGTISLKSPAARKAFFPEASDKAVAYWLFGSAASVFGIVVFGGLTRLTESGLSITEWRPVTGSLPPTTPEMWNSEFSKYRSSPEFALLNPNMTLSEFKKIYWMEWTHRLWGRVIGLTFLIPTIYFIARRRVSAPMALKLTGICGLIGFQGVIGWWMVKSGLRDDLFAPGSHPRVSQYRLATHLGAAFLVYSSMLLSGLSILRERALLADPQAGQKLLATLQHPKLRLFRRSVAGLAVLVFTTAMSGALVAGLDAGLIYNEFPYMGLGLTPPKSELFDPFYSHEPDRSDLWWRNMTANPSLVQLDHRILATTTFTAIMALWAYSRFSPRVRAALPLNAKKGVRGVVHLAWLQVTLGISTLLYLVPTWLAAGHQAGSLALLTGVLVLGSRVWVPRRMTRLLQKRLVVGESALRGGSRRGVGLGVGGAEQKRV